MEKLSNLLHFCLKIILGVAEIFVNEILLISI